MKRKRIDKPTPRMRDTAWRTLHEVAADPLAADHARVSASRAIVRGDTDDDTPAKDKAPPVITWLPYDGRNPTLTRTRIPRRSAAGRRDLRREERGGSFGPGTLASRARRTGESLQRTAKGRFDRRRANAAPSCTQISEADGTAGWLTSSIGLAFTPVCVTFP